MNTRPRVLVVTAFLDVGGTERHLLQVLPRLREQHCEVDVFTLRPGGSLDSAFRAAGICVYQPARDYSGIVGRGLSALALLRHLSRRRYDVVHYFLPAAYVIGATCSVLSTRAKRIMSRRSLNLYQRALPVYPLVERLLHRLMFRVVGNSNAVLADLRAEGVEERRLVLIYNGVTASATLSPEERSAIRSAQAAGADTLVLICVANLMPYKGHADVIQALASAAPELGADWQAWFVGRDSGIGRALAERTVALGIADHVKWLGESAAVEALLQSADVAIQCSREEGFSNAILEAMAAGLPVIATAVGGNVDAVVDEVTGILVEPGSADSIAAAVLRLAGRPELRRELGAAGRRRAAEAFSVERCVDGYVGLYREAVESGRHSIRTRP